MKKILFLIYFLFVISSLFFSRTNITFTKIALDDDKKSTIQMIKRDYKGKFTVNEYEGYKIQIDGNTFVEIYFDNDIVTYVSVEHKNYSYSEYIDLLGKFIKKHGEPMGTYTYDEKYQLYWLGNPPHDVSLSITLGDNFTVVESVLYGK